MVCHTCNAKHYSNAGDNILNAFTRKSGSRFPICMTTKIQTHACVSGGNIQGKRDATGWFSSNHVKLSELSNFANSIYLPPTAPTELAQLVTLLVLRTNL